MLEIVKRGNGEHGERSTRALLFTAVRNCFLDRVRHGRVLSFSGNDDGEAVAGTSDGGGGTRPTGVALDMDVLLAHLKPEEREALYLNEDRRCRHHPHPIGGRS